MGSLDQIQADQGGPTSTMIRRVTRLQRQEQKKKVQSVSKRTESHRAKLEGKQLLKVGGS